MKRSNLNSKKLNMTPKEISKFFKKIENPDYFENPIIKEKSVKDNVQAWIISDGNSFFKNTNLIYGKLE